MSYACRDYRTFAGLSRRSLLKVGSAGIAGLNLPSLLRAAEGSATPAVRPSARAKHVIFLHQFGGPSHLDTFDMKPDSPDGVRGEFQPIASDTPGLYLSEHLPRFAKVLGKFAQIRSVHHRMKNHNSATYYSLTGHAPPVDDIRLRDTQELYPAYGSTVARFLPSEDPALPTFVAYPHVLRDGSVTPGQTGSFLGKAHDPFFISDDPNRQGFRLPELTLPESLPLDRLDDRRGLLREIDRQGDLLAWSATAQGIDAFYERAVTMLAAPRVRRAFDL
ncbi:MAG: DUF1501 domain-containing protein, partial [Isosphaeraceae bacterium]